MALTYTEAKTFYDEFGARQDSQGFYEDPALDILAKASEFGRAENVFEFGCGTGRFAERLLTEELPPSANYIGCDISPVMLQLSRQRLSTFGARAVLLQSDARIAFPLGNGSVDRVISTYVLDLLDEKRIRAVLDESLRVLSAGGLLCLIGLTHGAGPVSRIVSLAWKGIYRVRPTLVGGCRPISLRAFADPQRWEVRTRERVAPWGISSEILVARPRIPPRPGMESVS
ncbi:MAG: class I SAM-dependent methyltransferase [Gammaproteobacteria bacterium]|nr:class I SAM-dependent methyltransferase [Gammaproteobacteria bacterium]